jgi:hypothetical protein
MSLAKRALPNIRNVRLAGFNISTRLCTVALLALFVVLAGCSTRFLYNRLDTFIVWKIDGYVSLEKEQKTELKQRLSDQLEFIRTNEMPLVAAGLQETGQEIQTTYVTPEMLDKRYQETMALFDKLMLGIIPVSEWFLLSLSDEQIDELFENLEEINQEMYEDYSGRTDEERQKNRNKSAVKFVKRFTGRLRAEQKLIITDSLSSMADSSEQWIEYQREWQRRFRSLIVDQPPTDQFRAELTTLFVYPRSFHSDEYRAIVDANRLIFYDMMAELINSLSDSQRARVGGKLDGYADMLLKLSNSPT